MVARIYSLEPPQGSILYDIHLQNLVTTWFRIMGNHGLEWLMSVVCTILRANHSGAILHYITRLLVVLDPLPTLCNAT